MKKLLLTVAAAGLALSGQVLAQESTGAAAGMSTLAGTGVTCGPQTASTGTSTDTTASTSGTSTDTSGTSTGTSTDTTASTSGTSTDTSGTSTGTSTDTTASTSGTSTGTSTDTTASTSGTSTGTSTDTTASTSGAAGTGSSTMALSADNQITADTARSALTGFSTNKDKFASLTTPTVVCIVDLDTMAASDTTLQTDISGAQANKEQIKSTLQGNTAVMGVIQSQHPTFDVEQVRALDIGPNGELVLYVSRSS
jgi:hypothetical protein